MIFSTSHHEGQMGNSEVGHINLGAGRIVYQDLAKINLAVQHGAPIGMPKAFASLLLAITQPRNRLLA